MRAVDDYAKIRTAHRDGLTIRQIARSFHVSRRKVREALAHPEPRPYTCTKPPPAPVLGPFTAIIDQVLRNDRDAPPKQRHTAAQLFRRLQDEHGYPGSYPTVRRYVAAHRRTSTPTFIPLAHPPGHRLEADFGHIHIAVEHLDQLPEEAVGLRLHGSLLPSKHKVFLGYLQSPLGPSQIPFAPLLAISSSKMMTNTNPAISIGGSSLTCPLNKTANR
jgi:hypothetical protein